MDSAKELVKRPLIPFLGRVETALDELLAIFEGERA